MRLSESGDPLTTSVRVFTLSPPSSLFAVHNSLASVFWVAKLRAPDFPFHEKEVGHYARRLRQAA